MTLHYSRPFTGGTLKVQDVPLEDISSLRRNPVLADVMAQLDYMEKRGSGLKRICNETKALEAYKDDRRPVFKSSPSQFMTIIYSMEYEEGTTEKTTEKVDEFSLNGKELARSWQGVGKELGVDFNILKDIADFCVEAHSLSEIAEHLGLSDRYKMKKKYIDPILGNYIEMTIPDAPNSKLQKYILTDTGRELGKIKH